MCVIVAHPTPEGVFLYKSRDRNYKSKIAVVHTLLHDTEVAFIFDLQTGWVEGINEHGLGFVNSALSVLDDEKEIMKITNNTKLNISKKSKKILHALSLKSLEDIYTHLAIERLTGHTLLSDGRDLLIIEQTSEHLAKVEKIKNLRKTVVRTNHGIQHSNTGYVEGIDRLSSASRLYETIKAVGTISDGRKIPEVLRAVESPLGRYFDPVRADHSQEMLTRSQLTLDLSGLHFKLGWIPNVAEFRGILKKLPEGYAPKITIEVEKLSDFAEYTK